MADMAYIRRSNKTLAETVEAVQTAASEANWTVLAVHDMKQRFVNKGFDWDRGLTIVEVCNSGFASAMVEANPLLALHLPCPVVVREDDHGVEVSVLRPSYVSSLFPTTFFGEGPAESEADITAIVDDAVS